MNTALVDRTISLNRALTASLDNFSIWNYALSQQEISNLYHECLEGSEVGLLAYYDFNDGSGTTLSDKSINGYDGTLVNSPVWSSDVPPCDSVKPIVTITGVNNSQVISNPYPISIMFSEAITGFESMDIQVTNGSIINFMGSASMYTADISATGIGTTTVQVPADAVHDDAGNGNSPSDLFSINYIEADVDMESRRDLYLNGLNNSSGLIMKDENGGCWKLTIDSTGSLRSTQIPCPN